MKKTLFDYFNNLVIQIANQFYVWRDLQKSEYNSGYSNRPHFWSTIISTLQHGFLLNLVNIFDDDERLLTVYEYLKEVKDETNKQALIKLVHEEKYTKVIKQLVKWRGNYLAHKNKYFTKNTAELTRKFPFKYDDIEILIELLVYILDITKKDFDDRDATCYIDYYQILCRNCERDTRFVIENGLNIKAYKATKK